MPFVAAILAAAIFSLTPLSFAASGEVVTRDLPRWHSDVGSTELPPSVHCKTNSSPELGKTTAQTSYDQVDVAHICVAQSSPALISSGATLPTTLRWAEILLQI